jgi:hypothetical protein
MHSRHRTIDDMMNISDGHNPYHYIEGRGGIENGRFKQYDKSTLDTFTPSELVKNYWFNKNIDENIDNDDEDEYEEDLEKAQQEQADLITTLYNKIKSNKKLQDDPELEEVIRDEESTRQYLASKDIDTTVSGESEPTKEINRALRDKGIQSDKILKVAEDEIMVSPDTFTNNNEFELRIAGIYPSQIIPQGRSSIKRLNADYSNLSSLDNDYIRMSIETVPPLVKEINDYKKRGYKIEVMSYNTDMDVFHNNRPIFAGNKNFKVDTFVDIRAVKGNDVVNFDKNLLIEDKFYGKSYKTSKDTNIAKYRKELSNPNITDERKAKVNTLINKWQNEPTIYTPKDIPYYSEKSIEYENKEYEIFRKDKINKLRDMKEVLDTYKKVYDKETDENKLKLIRDKYKELKRNREDLKAKLSNIEELKEDFYKTLPTHIGLPVQATKAPVRPEIVNNPNPNEYEKEIQKIVRRANSYFYLKPDGTTSKLFDAKGEVKGTKRTVKGGEQGDKLFITKNAKRFENRYLVDAIADNNRLTFGHVKKNLEPGELGRSAYGKEKTSTMSRLSERNVAKINIKDQTKQINKLLKQIENEKKEYNIR